MGVCGKTWANWRQKTEHTQSRPRQGTMRKDGKQMLCEDEIDGLEFLGGGGKDEKHCLPLRQMDSWYPKRMGSSTTTLAPRMVTYFHSWGEYAAVASAAAVAASLERGSTGWQK